MITAAVVLVVGCLSLTMMGNATTPKNGKFAQALIGLIGAASCIGILAYMAMLPRF